MKVVNTVAVTLFVLMLGIFYISIEWMQHDFSAARTQIERESFKSAITTQPPHRENQ